MRKWKIALLVLAMVIVPTFVGGFAGASVFRSGEVVKAEKGEKIDHTVFAAGEKVTIEADIDGDVFCAGSDIVINGNISGDVMCAGRNIRIDGVVAGDVRLGAMNVMINGKVQGSASVAAQSFTTDSKAVVGRDLTAIAASTNINGIVDRDIVVNSQDTYINAIIGRDITATAESLSLGETAAVTGNIHYYSFNELTKASTATISGMVERHEPPRAEESSVPSWEEVVLGHLWMAATVLFVGVILAALFPRSLRYLTAQARETPGRVALAGSAALFATPLVAIILLFTGVGWLLSLLMITGSLSVLMISMPLLGHLLGTLIFHKQPSIHPVVATITGMLILMVLQLIPIVGLLFAIITFAYALGVVSVGVIRANHSQHSGATTPKVDLAKS